MLQTHIQSAEDSLTWRPEQRDHIPPFPQLLFAVKVTHGTRVEHYNVQVAASAAGFMGHLNKFVFIVIVFNQLFCELDRIKFLEFVNVTTFGGAGVFQNKPT